MNWSSYCKNCTIYKISGLLRGGGGDGPVFKFFRFFNSGISSNKPVEFAGEAILGRFIGVCSTFVFSTTARPILLCVFFWTTRTFFFFVDCNTNLSRRRIGRAFRVIRLLTSGVVKITGFITFVLADRRRIAEMRETPFLVFDKSFVNRRGSGVLLMPILGSLPDTDGTSTSMQPFVCLTEFPCWMPTTWLSFCWRGI